MTRPLNRLHRQRGAATLLAAVFLVISVSLMVVVVLNMAGSDISDTAMQSDAVEALFIAESGVEQASWLYANGTACVALIGTTNSVGRGDFTITDAQLVSGDCRVRVEGTVTQTHDVKRTLDADLRLNSGGVFAVGDNGTILEWDGAAWNAVASGTGQNITGIDCPTANYCVAVTSSGSILEWNGAWSTGWSNPWYSFTGVDCLDNDPGNCFVSGVVLVIGFVSHWNGVTLSNSHFAAFRTYQDVGCSAGECAAVSSAGHFVQGNAGGWTQEASLGHPFNGVSCPSDDICWAVGDRDNHPNAYVIYGRDAAGNWTSSNIAEDPPRDLYDVDCFAINQCWAVGGRDGNKYNFVYRNGANWALGTQDLGGGRDLNGVSCSSDGQCWAVGDNGRTLYWDGLNWDEDDAWTVVASGTTENLNDVFFSGSGGGGAGAVTLVRWEEVVQ